MKKVFIVDDSYTNLALAKDALEGKYRSFALSSAEKMFKTHGKSHTGYYSFEYSRSTAKNASAIIGSNCLPFSFKIIFMASCVVKASL